MADKNRFTAATKKILEKRSGSICSNPYCKTLTTGPHTDETKAINLGEAAHIKGANPGSARYDSSMSSAERRNIVNAIWLCGRCAKLIDSDSTKYTIDLLYSWKRNHERSISNDLTKSGWEREILDFHLKPFQKESPTARQIAIDQPEHWEYLLTVELLRNKLNIVRSEQSELKRGLRFRPSHILQEKEYIIWFQEKINDLQNLLKFLNITLVEELPKAWGEPGNPGDPIKILNTCNKIATASRHLLNWEEDVIFTQSPESFEEVSNGMKGWTNEIFSENYKISEEISKIFQNEIIEGSYKINLTYHPPSNMGEIGDLFVKLAKGIEHGK